MNQLPLFEEMGPIPIRSELTLTYCGPATLNHTINAELYAQSLLGFSKSFKKANKKLIDVDINLDLKTQKPGSVEALVDFFSQKEIVAGAVFIAYLQFFGLDAKAAYKLPVAIFKMIIDVIKKGKGNKKQIKGEIESLELPKEAIERAQKLIENNDFRINLDEMTLFLEMSGMESFSVKINTSDKIKINKSDRPYFVAQPEDEVTVEIDEKVVSLSYISPEKHRWQFKSGSTEFWAEVKDRNFISEMQDKALEDITDLQFTATIEKTSTREAKTKRSKTDRTISQFKPYSPPKQSSLF